MNTKKDDNYECSQRTGGLSEPGDPIPLRLEVIADKKVRSGKGKGRRFQNEKRMKRKGLRYLPPTWLRRTIEFDFLIIWSPSSTVYPDDR